LGEGEGKIQLKRKERTELSRQLRKDLTEAERALWARLRGYQVSGLKFRRQQPIGPYIVDFVCFEKKIVIEVDGGQHGEESVRQRDDERTAWLHGEGFRVLRFWNNEALANLEGLLEVIRQMMGDNCPSPKSSPTRGEDINAPSPSHGRGLG